MKVKVLFVLAAFEPALKWIYHGDDPVDHLLLLKYPILEPKSSLLNIEI